MSEKRKDGYSSVTFQRASFPFSAWLFLQQNVVVRVGVCVCVANEVAPKIWAKFLCYNWQKREQKTNSQWKRRPFVGLRVEPGRQPHGQMNMVFSRPPPAPSAP